MFIHTFVVYKKKHYTDVVKARHTRRSGGVKAWCVVLFCFIPSTLGAPTLPTAVVMPRTFCTGCIAWIRCSDWQLNCEPESLGAVPPHTVCTDTEGSGLCQWVDPVRGDLLYVSVCICKCKNCNIKQA